MNSLLMALSAARGKNIPIMFVPSMHNDLAGDILTKETEKEAKRHQVARYLQQEV